ncbi:MAG: glycosyltransferase [Alphaproteobacteria bacterium]|nr:glycosyltransferase [Alphaproteobacteria bacterium]
MSQKYLFDFSLGVVNRTGAFMIVRDVLEKLPRYIADVRFWRLIQRDPPDGLWRKCLARLMMLELTLLGDSRVLPWPDSKAAPGRRRVYFDPLYVLRGELERGDIVQCHDIGPISHPELFSWNIARLYRMAYAKIQRVGPGMVFVSDATHQAFRAHFGDQFRFMQTIIQYVRPGVTDGDMEPVHGLPPTFLLTVGALERRKNHVRVMEAYQRSGLCERGVPYVFCGARGLDSTEIMRVARRIPGVIPLGYVSEKQLRWLYAHARGFVLPSLLEGFGLPALEAAHKGLVSLVSAGGAQEECVGGGAVLVDPTNVRSIADGLIKLVDMSDDERATLLRRVQAHADKLTYDAYVESWDTLLSRNDAFPESDGWGQTLLSQRTPCPAS